LTLFKGGTFAFISPSELVLRRDLEQRTKLFRPVFVAKVKVEWSQAVAICNLTAYFAAFGKVVSVEGYHHMRGKGMPAYFAVSVFVIAWVGVVFVHESDLGRRSNLPKHAVYHPRDW
jgi:hypothetical protein